MYIRIFTVIEFNIERVSFSEISILFYLKVNRPIRKRHVALRWFTWEVYTTSEVQLSINLTIFKVRNTNFSFGLYNIVINDALQGNFTIKAAIKQLLIVIFFSYFLLCALIRGAYECNLGLYDAWMLPLGKQRDFWRFRCEKPKRCLFALVPVSLYGLDLLPAVAASTRGLCLINPTWGSCALPPLPSLSTDTHTHTHTDASWQPSLLWAEFPPKNLNCTVRPSKYKAVHERKQL